MTETTNTDEDTLEPSAKRPRQSPTTPTPSSSLTLFPLPPTEDTLPPLRTSSLTSPTLKLTGHKSSVYGLSYSPNGELLVSSSFDTTCLIWSGSDSCSCLGILSGHKNAVLDVQFASDSEHVVSASADHTLGLWDVTTETRVKRFIGHEGIVNAVDCPRCTDAGTTAASAGDDRTVRLWDRRVRGNVGVLEHEYQVTAVAYGLDGNTVYSAGIDNLINAWDVRKAGGSRSGGGGLGGQEGGSMTMKMKGHTDTITSLSLSPKGTHLLSNSMDGTLKTWDIRPFVDGGGGKRQCKTFEGATHNAEKGLLNCAWSSDGMMVTGGSADKIVHIWDEPTSEELYYLPGHTGCVNAVVFHPKENVVASASSDKTIFVGELSN